MHEASSHHWFIVCAAGCILSAGCMHGRSTTQPSKATPVAAAPRAVPIVARTPARQAPVEPVNASIALAPAVAAPVPEPAAPVQAELIVAGVPVLPVTRSEPQSVPPQSESQIILTGATVVSPPAPSVLRHAEDYSWLIGELRYVHCRRAWHLRYATLDEEDRYGGSVTLIETGPMTKYQDGQRVRVQGTLVHPDCRDASPAYRVTAIETLDGDAATEQARPAIYGQTAAN